MLVLRTKQRVRKFIYDGGHVVKHRRNTVEEWTNGLHMEIFGIFLVTHDSAVNFTHFTT